MHMDENISNDEAIPEILSPGEVARIFGVHPKTVTRWAVAGSVPSFRTPGGHRRFKASDVRAALGQ
jgi:excisionase family DNA binding protein